MAETNNNNNSITPRGSSLRNPKVPSEEEEESDEEEGTKVLSYSEKNTRRVYSGGMLEEKFQGKSIQKYKIHNIEF